MAPSEMPRTAAARNLAARSRKVFAPQWMPARACGSRSRRIRDQRIGTRPWGSAGRRDTWYAPARSAGPLSPGGFYQCTAGWENSRSVASCPISHGPPAVRHLWTKI